MVEVGSVVVEVDSVAVEVGGVVEVGNVVEVDNAVEVENEGVVVVEEDERSLRGVGRKSVVVDTPEVSRA